MLRELLNRLSAPADEAQPERLVALAAAALLLEVAWSDHEVSDEELALIRTHLEGRFHLDHDEVEELVAESKRDHEASVGVHPYTRTINDHWNESQKFELLVALWSLALADDELHHYEEHTIRRIAELLYLTHSRFIEAKHRAAGEI